MNSFASNSERSLLLAEMTSFQLAELLRKPEEKVALIPVGSTEAHGPHLPLNTDVLISEAMAKGSATTLQEQDKQAVIFPTLNYARTEWARSFPGSVSISVQPNHHVVLDICLQAKEMGFDHVVLLNAHFEPDHVTLLRQVAKDFQAKTGSPLVFPDPTRRKLAERLGEEFQSGACHAGRYESSLILAIRPDLVRRDEMEKLEELPVSLSEAGQKGATSFVDCGMEQAYCGNPAAASAEEGRAYLETLISFVMEGLETANDNLKK